jgi:hypothetical protein
MTRASRAVIAPSTPVAWSPGTPPLSESLRARVLAGAGSAAERAVRVMPATGRPVVALRVEAPRRRVIGSLEPRPATAPRIPVPVAHAVSTMGAPWGEPDPVPGVVMRTSLVPLDWLRPSMTASPPALAPTVASQVHPIPVMPAPLPAPARSDMRPMPASVRIRKAAMMAFGLLVSLVAVEAAARVGRR